MVLRKTIMALFLYYAVTWVATHRLQRVYFLFLEVGWCCTRRLLWLCPGINPVHRQPHTVIWVFLNFWRLGVIMQRDYCHFWRLDAVRQRDYYGLVLVLTRHMGSHTPTSEGLFPFVRGRWCYARKLWWLENLSSATRGWRNKHPRILEVIGTT